VTENNAANAMPYGVALQEAKSTGIGVPLSHFVAVTALFRAQSIDGR
jgi:hypothetical protein